MAAAARVPFLLQADRYFDSDQAVEGLMARHVLTGEHPVFFWGQSYKGVPEVYLSALLFRFSGSGVVALKAVTVFLFGVYMALSFVVVDRLFGRAAAVVAACLAIAAPPAFVLWTMSANAEIVLSMICGTVLLLAVEWRARTRSPYALAVAGLSVGLGLWIHVYILLYAIALAAALLTRVPLARHRRYLARALRDGERPAWKRWVVWTLVGLGAVYTALAIMAFLSGGVRGVLLGLTVSVTHAQKLLRIGVLLGAAGFSIDWLCRAGWRSAVRLLVAPAIGFVLGYAPVLWSVASTGRFGAFGPIGRTDAAQLLKESPVFLREILPILAGLRSPDARMLLMPPAWGLLVVLCIGVAVLTARGAHRGGDPAGRGIDLDVFSWLVVVTVLAFLTAGSFRDNQTYRYLLILFAALPVIAARGIAAMPRLAGAAIFGVLTAGFVVQQAKWYALQPTDSTTPALIRCLGEHNLHAAYADYWVSYKLTFASDESIIAAPFRAVDRYPAYTRRVEAEPFAASIDVPPPPDRVVETRFDCAGVPAFVSRRKQKDE